MKEDRRAKQLARLEEMRRRTNERMEAQRQLVDARFDRARQRLMGSQADPNEDQKRIITAALELLDEVGLQELSLRKLAAKLDLKAPALYWHFKNKEALIDYMAEAILQSEFANLAPCRSDEAWQDWLVQLCSRLRRAMRKHRDGARVIAGAHLYPAVTLMRLFEISMVSLTNAGVETRRAHLTIMTSIHFVFGHVIEEQSSPSLEEVDQIDLSALAHDFPHMAHNIQQMMDDIQAGYDDFEDALRLIIGFAEA